MKICDKCYKHHGDICLSVYEVILCDADEHFHLCLSCMEAMRAWLTNNKRKAKPEIPDEKKEEEPLPKFKPSEILE